MNRLSQEKSPYLLEHQSDPVWWQPWDEAALLQARRENKPIFLSVGYSTCHWCHVMQRESFSSQAIAQVLNSHFVCIKVDREERPDLDSIYMSAVQQMTGHGGWPMSVWLTPDRLPFFGGTYFPRDQFGALLRKITEVWEQNRESLERDAQQMKLIVETLGGLPEAKDMGSSVHESILNQFVLESEKTFDFHNGGFSGAPKFPPAMTLMALARIAEFPNEAFKSIRTSIESMLELTLDRMARGGIFDHLNGGFHRYSTDDHWGVPHFEKMLYDNAWLTLAYLEADQRTPQLKWQYVARSTLDYILHEMTSNDGGFFSAQDADSLSLETGKKEEGFFATFSPTEIESELDHEELQSLSRHFEIPEQGNLDGRIVFSLKLNASWERDPQLSRALSKLKKIRDARPAPHRDEKILTEWNGYMIAAMARAYRVLGDERYLHAAQRACAFILSHLVDQNHRLKRHSYHGQTAPQAGFASDYAAMIWGLLELYQTDFDERWFHEAVNFQTQMDRFWDEEKKGYFEDDGEDKTLIARYKETYDGVTPSANSLASWNLQILYHLTLEPQYMERIQDIFLSFRPVLIRAPHSVPQMISSLAMYLSKAREMAYVVAADRKSPSKDSLAAWVRVRHQGFTPFDIVAAKPAEHSTQIPLLKDKRPMNGRSTLFVCQGHSCSEPRNID